MVLIMISMILTDLSCYSPQGCIKECFKPYDNKIKVLLKDFHGEYLSKIDEIIFEMWQETEFIIVYR